MAKKKKVTPKKKTPAKKTGAKAGKAPPQEVKEAEKALAKAADEWLTILDSTQDAIMLLDTEHRILRANRAAGEFAGVPPDSLVGKTCHQVVHDLHAPPEFCPWKQMLATKKRVQVETQLANGGRWLAITMDPVLDPAGNVAGAVHAACDITARKDAEQELRASEERFRVLFENAPLGYQALDAEGNLIEVNESWCSLLGYAKEQVLGKNFSEFLPADYRERFADFKKVGYILGHEFEMIKKDGTEIIVALDGKIGRREDGSFKQTHCVLSDITERKRAEEVLEKRHRELESLYCISEAAIVDEPLDATLAKIVREVSLSTEFPICAIEFYDESRQLMKYVATTGMPDHDSPFPLEVPVSQTLSGVAAQTGKPIVETRAMDRPEYASEKLRELQVNTFVCVPMVIKDRVVGTLSLADPDVAPVDENLLPLVEILANSIAGVVERKRAEQAERQKAREIEIRNSITSVFLTASDEEMYHEVLKIVLEVMVSEYGVFGYVDENGDFVVPSMTRHIWDKCNIPDKRYVFPRDTWGDSSWPRSIREKRSIYSNEPSTDTPQGHIGITRHISMPIIDQEEVVGLFQVANKATDYDQDDIELLDTIAKHVAPILSARLQRDKQQRHRELAEKAAIAAKQELLEKERQKKELAEAELAKIREELVRKTRLAAIGQVSGSIAHDLRNPLGSVRNAAYYLKRHAPKDQPKTTQFLEIIETQVTRADKIISALLEITRSKAPAAASIDLRKMVEEVLDHLQDIDGIRCTMTMTMAPDPYLFHADPELFRQVVTNLVDNAAEAMNGKGELIVEASYDDGAAIIVFRDSGPGVLADVRDSLFEPLVTSKTTGTGLGLSICRQIVERHSGTIELLDEDKPGAAFRISLPRGQDQEENET